MPESDSDSTWIHHTENEDDSLQVFGLSQQYCLSTQCSVLESIVLSREWLVGVDIFDVIVISQDLSARFHNLALVSSQQKEQCEYDIIHDSLMFSWVCCTWPENKHVRKSKTKNANKQLVQTEFKGGTLHCTETFSLTLWRPLLP